MIEENIAKLGFKLTDVKVLLSSHAHFDHAAGSALIKQLTGAKYMVMDADVPVVEDGGRSDFQYGRSTTSLFEPTKVDRVLHDRDEVRLGNVVLVAHLTAGHTKGCTTWTMKVVDGGRRRDMIRIICAPLAIPLQIKTLLTERTLHARGLWDILGFADYVVGVRKG